MHFHPHYAARFPKDYSASSHTTMDHSQRLSAVPMPKRSARQFAAPSTQASLPGPSSCPQYLPQQRQQQADAYRYATPYGHYYSSSPWASSGSSAPDSSYLVNYVERAGVSSGPVASIPPSGKYLYAQGEASVWQGYGQPCNNDVPSTSNVRSSVSPAESSSGSDSSYLDPGESLSQVPGPWSATSQPLYQHPLPLDSMQYSIHMPYSLQAEPVAYPSLQQPSTLNTAFTYAPRQTLPNAPDQQSRSPPTPSSPPPMTPSAFEQTAQAIPIHAPKPYRLDVKAWLAKSALDSLTEAESAEQESEQLEQQATLSPLSLLCQPAPPSILYPPKTAGTSDITVQHLPHGPQEPIHSHACLPDITPYDTSQNVLVCSCGCMESYSVT